MAEEFVAAAGFPGRPSADRSDGLDTKAFLVEICLSGYLVKRWDVRLRYQMPDGTRHTLVGWRTITHAGAVAKAERELEQIRHEPEPQTPPEVIR
jgi:hypothetical protein